MQHPASVLARKFTAEHTKFAEIIKTFLCELSLSRVFQRGELGGKNNQVWATKLNRRTIQK
jgi:hypothetical protein